MSLAPDLRPAAFAVPIAGEELLPASATAILERLIYEACKRDVSDIHIDPTAEGIEVRARIDGLLHSIYTLGRELHAELISRIKVLAGLRTDEHFVAQDGRFRFREHDTDLDVRVSIAPTYYGENAVLRLLVRRGDAHALEALGMSNKHETMLADALRKTHGLILVTGPTGSGKTTTLYSLISMLRERPVSIVTVEDPIEYSMPGVTQIPVNERSGLSFSAGLRSILRQDPDVIMVGEIRDAETARLSVNAALTGHLVLSTLHTTDAPTVLPRLLDLGIEPYLVASTVSLVIGQRLLRRLCTDCCARELLSETEWMTLAERFGEHLDAEVYRAKGCTSCGGTGYRGRIGAYELMTLTERLREGVFRRASADELRALARSSGMQGIQSDGAQKARVGVTTYEEVLRHE